MRKRFAKLVSYLLVAALVMQDGVMAAAANHAADAEVMTVSEEDSEDSMGDKEEAGDDSSDVETMSEEKELEEERSEGEPSKESESEEQSTKERETTEDSDSSEQTTETEETETIKETEKTEETNSTDEIVDETEETVEEEIKKDAEEETQKEEQIEEFVGYPGDEAIVDETNLLPDDLFAPDGDDLKHWTKWNASVSSMEPGEDQKSITIKMNATPQGAQWGTGIQYKSGSIGLESGGTYQISYKITSTVARKVTVDFDEKGDNDRREITLKANTETLVQYMDTVGGDWSKFSFFLGETDNSADYGAHDITISDVSIRKVTVKLQDGEPVEDNPDNLLTNGTFADGTTEGWDINKETATVKTAQYKVAFDITGNPADWQIWLKQDFKWESSAKYKITFDATSTVDRYIMAGSDGGTWLRHKELKANVPTKVEYQVCGMNGGNFVIALGSGLRGSSIYQDWDGNEIPADEANNQTLEPHRVVISNVCIAEIPPELPDTPNDRPYTKITDLKNYDGYQPSELFPLKDGRFTQPVSVRAGAFDESLVKTDWLLWHEAWMTQWRDDAVTCTPVEGGMAVYVEVTGGGEENKPWDVQLGQKISLSSNAEYVLSFKVTSEKARSINVSIADIDNGNAWVKPIAIQKGETREVILNLPVLRQDAIEKTFQIQMGNVSGNVADNTLTFTDLKLEVNGYSEMAERIADGSFEGGDQGRFTAEDNQKATVSFDDSYIKAEITSACAEEDVVISSGSFDLLGESERRLYAYEVSFVAGATDNRTVKAVLEDGSGKQLAAQAFDLTTDAEKYSFTYKPEAPKKNVVLKLLLGGSEETICVDTIRCDLKGYPEAAGLDTEGHDITLLEKKAVPVISEMPADQAVKGHDIIISFDKEGNEDYKEAIASVYINGKKINDTGYQIGERTNEGGNAEYIITLDDSLFDVEGERQTFTIEVKAPWYQNNRIRQTVYQESPWNSTWLEEFDGTSLDMDKWSYQVGTGDNNDGWGNNEQQCYTSNSDNIKVGNGELTITARKQRNDSGRPYTSARIWTMEDDGATAKFSQTYGRMEAKMKLAGGDGYEGVWPAFWMLPVDLHYGTWPLSGEIDILEARGREPLLADGTVHYGKPWPNNESHGDVFDYSKSQYNSDSDINDYHIYAVEWETGEIRWYVDDELYFTYSNWYCQSPDNPDKFRYPAPFDQDFYIILNLAVGGTFDNNLMPDDNKMPVDMKVDYVRVYESKNGYEDVTEEPPVIKDEGTDIAQVKSELYDTDFAGINIVQADGIDLQRDVWNLVMLPGFGGSAGFTTITQDGNVYAKITPRDLGIAAHAIQLIQHLDLVKGYNYRISFDAWTEGSRKLNMKIGQDGSEGWNTYQTFETSLTSSPQHYKYEFQSGVTDLHSRVEFNLATNGQPVYIGNVKYEVIDEITIDPDAEKKPSENGNCVYNGSFDVGGIDGLSYWHMDNSDGKTQREGKGYVFTATKGNLYQYGLQLLQSDTYELTFAADAASEREIEVILSDKEGKTVYAREKVILTPNRENKKVTFTMPAGVTDSDARLCFEFGEGSSRIKLTDIWLKWTTYNNVEWEEVNAHPLLNGDFELGNLYWSDYNAQFEVVTDPDNANNHYAKVIAPQGGNKWDALLSYDSLSFTAKTDYEFSFDVKATEDDETIRVTMEDAGYYAHYEQKELAVGKEWRTYTFDVRFTDNMDNLALKFQTGGAGTAHEVYFDNVIIRAKGAPKAPGILMAEKYNRLGADIVLSYDGEEEWVRNAVVYIDGVRIDADKAVFGDGKLTLDKSVFSESKAYTLAVRSAGYTASRNIAIVLYPADGNRILNGGFTLGKNGLNYWDQYIKDQDKDYVTSEDGAAKIHYGGPSYDGGNLVPWAIQFFQDGIPVESGKKYQLSFYAYATTERRIQVMRNQGQGELSQYVAITKEPELYELDFVSTGDHLKLQFLLSTVAKEDGAPILSEDALEAHDIYLDNVCLLEMVDGEVIVDKSTLKKLVDEYSTVQQDKDKYTEESYSAFLAAFEAAREILAKKDAKQAEVNHAEDNLRKTRAELETRITMLLSDLITECKTLKEEEYSKESWGVLADALDKAENVMADPDKTEEAMQDAYNNLKKAKDRLIPAVITMDNLKNLLVECESLDQNAYTSESWDVFVDALNRAKGVAENPDAEQKDIENAYIELANARAALELEKPATKADLNRLITECDALEQEEYEDATWTPFAKALETAKAVVQKSDASQEEIQNAYDALNDAKSKLIKIGEQEPVNKDQLRSLILECEELNRNDYDKDSWATFTRALADAKAAAEDPAVSQETVRKAFEQLSEALEQLKEREGLWAFDIADITYTGKALKPAVAVYNGRTLLTQGRDYTVSYKKNTKVTSSGNEAQAVIKGKGNYTGSITKTFRIVPKSLGDEDIVIADLYVKAPKAGKSVTPAPVVTRSGKKLNKKEYAVATIKDEDGNVKEKVTDPGTYTVEVRGVENNGYTGTREIHLTVLNSDQVLMSAVKVSGIKNIEYASGEPVRPEFTVKYGKNELTEDVDYEVICGSREVGAATAIIKGIGATYVGEKTVNFKITGTVLKAKDVTLQNAANAVYTGGEIRPDVMVADAIKDTDYTVTYDRNDRAGAASVIVKGIGKYTGTVKKTFKIAAFDISENDGNKLTYQKDNLTAPYRKSGSILRAEDLNIVFGGVNLVEGVDYTLVYSSNKKAGAVASVKIKGKGNFKGTTDAISFIVEQQDLSNLTDISAADVLKKKAGNYESVSPVIKDLDGKALKKGTDFTNLRYTKTDGTTPIDGIPNVGDTIRVTVDGTGNYKGTAYADFRIIADNKNISKAKVKVEPQTYTGKEIILSETDPVTGVRQITVTMKVGNITETLTQGTDYEIVTSGYSKNTNKGTAKMTIRGINDYGGTKTVSFKIKSCDIKDKVEWYENLYSRTMSWFGGMFAK